MLYKCLVCGKTYEGNKYNFYCKDCAEKIKKNVLRKRICIDCGIEFFGGPRAKRCKKCANIAKKEAKKRYHNNPNPRKIGSVSLCKRCGKEYIVNSARQIYCHDCAREASLEWQRDHKKGYDKFSGQYDKKVVKRNDKMKICLYCLKEFKSNTSSSYCSEYCKKHQLQIQLCESDIKRGRNRNLNKYIDERDKYRENKKLPTLK